MNWENVELLWLSCAWIGFFLLHSLLANPGIKHTIQTRYSAIAPCYRLLYNLIALLSLVPVFLIHVADDSRMLWSWHGTAAMIANLLALLAVAGFIWSLKYYDLAAFSGIAGCRGNSVATTEALVISPLHRYLRHPWYFFALVIIWCRDQTLLDLVSSIMVSAYFFIGARFEERSLIGLYGDAYRQYMRLVPGIMPLPWRRISKQKAIELMNQASRQAVNASPRAYRSR